MLEYILLCWHLALKNETDVTTYFLTSVVERSWNSLKLWRNKRQGKSDFWVENSDPRISSLLIWNRATRTNGLVEESTILWLWSLLHGLSSWNAPETTMDTSEWDGKIRTGRFTNAGSPSACAFSMRIESCSEKSNTRLFSWINTQGSNKSTVSKIYQCRTGLRHIVLPRWWFCQAHSWQTLLQQLPFACERVPMQNSKINARLQ